MLSQIFAPGSLPAVGALLPMLPAASAPATSAKPLADQVSVLDSAVANNTQEQQFAQQPPRPDQPLRVLSTELGLNVPILPSRLPADRRFNPPSNVLAYWLDEYGSAGPAAKNTLYLAAHSWNDGYAAFNPLMNIAAGTARVRIGQQLTILTSTGNYRYRVTQVADYRKSSITSEKELWKAIPGRLVLVTCFQLNDAGANRNLVIYAQLEKGT